MIKKNSRKPLKVIPIPNKWITIIILVSVIIFLIFEKYQEQRNVKENKLNCYAELKREISGTVEKCFFDDDINVKAFVIYFTNGKKYINPIFEKSLSGYVNPGDSVYKKGGTFKFIIFRKERYDNPVIIVEDTVNCDRFYSK